MNPLQEFESLIEQDLDSAGMSNRGKVSALIVEGRRVTYKLWKRVTHPPELKFYLDTWWLRTLNIPF